MGYGSRAPRKPQATRSFVRTVCSRADLSGTSSGQGIATSTSTLARLTPVLQPHGQRAERTASQTAGRAWSTAMLQAARWGGMTVLQHVDRAWQALGSPPSVGQKAMLACWQASGTAVM